MITNLYLGAVTGALADQFHVPRAVRQRVVQQVAHGVLQALPIRQDPALI
jgi:hypothetical protein